MKIGSLLMVLGLGGVGVVAFHASDATESSVWLLIYLLLILIVAITGFAFMVPSVQALVSRLSDPARQGEVLGINQSMNAVARILGPAIGMPLYALGMRHALPYAFGATLLFIVLILTLRLAHRMRFAIWARRTRLMRRKGRIPLHEYPARRIAIIKPSALGDIIHSLPVLSALRRRYPDAHITWVVNKAYEPLLRGHPELDATLTFDRAAVRKGLVTAALAYGAFLPLVRQQKFDLVVDLQGLLRSGLMTMASGATRRVGLSTAREGATLFYTDVVPVADFKAIHAVDRYWLVAEALAQERGRRSFTFMFPKRREPGPPTSFAASRGPT